MLRKLCLKWSDRARECTGPSATVCGEEKEGTRICSFARPATQEQTADQALETDVCWLTGVIPRQRRYMGVSADHKEINDLMESAASDHLVGRLPHEQNSGPSNARRN